MKRKRFSVEQIVAVLKQAELGAPVADLIRHLGIAEQTFYRWKQRYAGLESEQVRQFKHLQEENAKLKRLVADLSLDKVMLQNVLTKNGEALAAANRRELSRDSLSDQRTAGLPNRLLREGPRSVSASSGSPHRASATDPGARSDPRALWLSEDSPHELLDDHNLYLTVAARHGQADILWMAVKDHIDSGVSYGDVPQLDLF